MTLLLVLVEKQAALAGLLEVAHRFSFPERELLCYLPKLNVQKETYLMLSERLEHLDLLFSRLIVLARHLVNVERVIPQASFDVAMALLLRADTRRLQLGQQALSRLRVQCIECLQITLVAEEVLDQVQLFRRVPKHSTLKRVLKRDLAVDVSEVVLASLSLMHLH